MRFFPAIFQVYWCRCHDDNSFANHSLKQSHVQQQPKCNEDTESKNEKGGHNRDNLIKPIWGLIAKISNVYET